MNYKLGFIIVLLLIALSSTASADIWVSDSSIIGGLGDVGINSHPTIYNDDGTWKLISGDSGGTFHGFDWNGTGWESNSSIISGLVDNGLSSTPTVFNDSGTWKLISGINLGTFHGFQWNGTGWESNSSIISGLVDTGSHSAPTVYNDDGTWKLISGDSGYNFKGYYWNGTGWESNSSIINGLGNPGDYRKPTIYNDDGTWKLISGEQGGNFYGFYWSVDTWVSDSNVINGLSDIGAWSAPNVYDDNGTLKLISGENDGVFNGYHWNNAPTTPTISSPSNNSYHTSQPITIQANSTDADGDSITYYFYGDTVDGSTLLGTSTNGTYIWHQALSGDYILKVRVYDGYEYSDYSNLVYFHSLIPPLLTIDLAANGDFEDWSGGPTSAPDDWTLYLGSITRSTIKKTGIYSAKLTPAPDMQLYQTVSDPLQYRNTVMTLGVWIKASTSSLVRISIKDNTGRTFSPHHTGSGNWEFLTVTRTIDASATFIRITPVHTSDVGGIIYVDGAILVEGAYPYVSEPLNNSVHTFDFPPLLHDLTFVWQDSDADGYKYQIATDENFNLISDEGSLSTYTTDVSLTAGDYFWRLFAYDPITDTYSDSSDIWQFTINETTISDGTAIDGVVYEITNAGSIAVEGALVNIWNTTWSDSMLVGQNGYYYFDGVDNSTYSLQATKTGYTDSAIELVTATSDATTTRNILLQKMDGAGQQYVDHYVKFTVKSLWETLYSDVTVNVYLGDAIIPQYTSTTGTDGSVAFELDENQEYCITFIDAAQNINKEITLYPVNNDYVIYVFTWTYIPDDTPLQTIDYGIASESINLTAGTIYASFTDTEPTFTHANFTIKAEDETVLYSFTTTDTSKNWSQIVTYNNSTIYIAVLEIFDTGLTNGKITQNAVISFKYGIRDNFDFGWEEQWQYQLFGALLMLFVAGLFSMTNAHLGAVVVVGIGWFNIYAGWFPSTITGTLMMLLGTFLAVIFVMRKQEKI